MSLQQIKVRSPDLLVGMYVTCLDRPWLETPYKIQGFLIKNQKDIDQLVQHTEYVFIDILKSRDVNDTQQTQSKVLTSDEKKQLLTNIKPQHYEDKTDFVVELDMARENHSVLTCVTEDIMDDIANNKNPKLPELKRAIDPIVDSIIRNSDAFSWLTMMKSKDKYTYNHCVNASIWSVVLGRSLGLPKKDLQSLAIGALLFDIGKMKLPEKLINNPNHFNQIEFNLVKKHVDYSVEIVKSINGINKDVVEMIWTHHERHNGGGYPRGLHANKIPLFGKIAGIIDCYDALISNRSFVSAISPHDAVRKLYDWSNIDFQLELVEQFIQVVGIYPVGTMIELSDGRVGVIVAHHKIWRLRPKIMVLLDKNKEPCPAFEVIDMFETETGEDGKELKILKDIKPGFYGIDPKQFYL